MTLTFPGILLNLQHSRWDWGTTLRTKGVDHESLQDGHPHQSSLRGRRRLPEQGSGREHGALAAEPRVAVAQSPTGGRARRARRPQPDDATSKPALAERPADRGSAEPASPAA